MRRAVDRNRIILAKSRARVLDVNAVLVLTAVKILYSGVGMSVDQSGGRVNEGYVAIRVGWGIVSGWSGHRYLSERDIGRVAGECVDIGREEGIVNIGWSSRQTIYVHDWHVLDERRRACACLYPGRLQWDA